MHFAVTCWPSFAADVEAVGPGSSTALNNWLNTQATGDEQVDSSDMSGGFH